MQKQKPKTLKKRVLKHLGKVGLAALSFSLMVSPVSAVEPVPAEVLGTEGGQKVAKAAIESALKVAKGKPAMSTATAIVCLACVPAAGATASPGLCIACGILLAKTIG